MKTLRDRAHWPSLHYFLGAAWLLLLAQPAAAQSQEFAGTLFRPFEDAGFTLQRALTGPEKGEAAAFSFLSDLEDETFFLADFALIWRPPTPPAKAGPVFVKFASSVEGKLTSKEAESEDAWRFRASLIGDGGRIGPVDSTYTSASLKYEGDQDFDTQKLMAEILLTPTMRVLGMGKRLPEPERDPVSGRAAQLPAVQFRWRPFLGLDVGRTLERGESAEVKDTVLRLLLRGRAQIFLNLLARMLGLQEATIFVDNTFYHMPLEDRKDRHNFLVAGLELLVTENVSVGFTYKSGEEAPNFEKIKTFGGMIGVQFGAGPN